MEELGQSYGYILYRTHIAGAAAGTLTLPGLHDYAKVYLNGKLEGTVDRRLDQTGLALHSLPTGENVQLDILVENTGRVNFGKAINGERAGLLAPPLLDGKPLTGWDTYSLPMLTPEALSYRVRACIGECFSQGGFQVNTPGDTFLDTGKLGKGFVWINGHPLGRFWNIGPQRTLFVPGPWLHAGTNQIVLFDLYGSEREMVEGRLAPILNAPILNAPIRNAPIRNLP
jgi:beta-galactosidase